MRGDRGLTPIEDDESLGEGLRATVVEALQQHGGRIALDASPTLGGLRATVALPAVRVGVACGGRSMRRKGHAAWGRD